MSLSRLAACAAFTVLLSALAYAGTASRPVHARVVTSLDQNWRFLKADASGAEKPEFNDAAWLKVNVPHDWSIEGPIDQSNKTGRAQGFFPAGIGWYRKHLLLPQSYAGRRVFIDFDGVMANSDVWINGEHLGRRPYGYVSFRYELTGKLKFGKQANVIAVRADNSQQPASRWYAGAGIYRHVRLVVTDPVHFDNHGVFVTTPVTKGDAATVRVQSTVVNQSSKPRNVRLQITLLAPDGKAAQSSQSGLRLIESGQRSTFVQDLSIDSPRRWDLDSPNLYRAAARISGADGVLDDETVAFGIREARFEAATGFWLNGRNLKIKGVCLHHDGGAFGAAVPLGVWKRRLVALRELGVNAIRTAHNPPAPEFLDLTDQMGFLVMDEMFDAWTVGKNPYDYHLYFKDWAVRDTVDTVQRDRNHPSVILYSAGNEIHDTPKPDIAKPILASLVETFHKYDPSRPVTQALFRPNVSHDYDNGLADMLDVVGQNYREKEILAAHKQKPSRKILGTENTHDLVQWLAMRDNAPYSGQFLWAGIDYIGESIGWPNVGRDLGLLDRTGAPRSLGFQRQSWWSERPMVYITRRKAQPKASPTDPGYAGTGDKHILTVTTDWTPRDTAAHTEKIEAYSNCEEVELFLNGKSLGSQKRPADDSARQWEVPFAPGKLTAVGRNGGKVVATHELQTAGKPSRIILTVDQKKLAPGWDDVAFVSATVVDDKGVRVPDATDLITFTTTGPGTVVAVDNADNKSHELFQTNRRHAYEGKCVAVVKARGSKGVITISASAPGLAAGKASIVAVDQGK